MRIHPGEMVGKAIFVDLLSGTIHEDCVSKLRVALVNSDIDRMDAKPDGGVVSGRHDVV